MKITKALNEDLYDDLARKNPEVGGKLANFFDEEASEQGIEIEDMGWGLDTDEQIQAVRDGVEGKTLTPRQTAALIDAADTMARESGVSIEEMTGISGLEGTSYDDGDED